MGETGLGKGIAKSEGRHISGPAALKPADEAPRVWINSTTQWSLAATENLALIREPLPAQVPGAR